MTQIKRGKVDVPGVTVAFHECGEGPLALCLHGFPDSAWTYQHLLPVLAEAGYRAVAPFQRGYAPTGLAADGRYHPALYASDAVALHEALGGDGEAALVGHDWGAFAAYGAATLAPERWRRVVGLAVAPGLGAASVFSSYEQLKRSFYIMLFQLPVAEEVVGAGDLAFLNGLWGDWCDDAAVAAAMADRAKDCVRSEGRLSAAIGPYRELMLPPADGLLEAAAALASIPTQPTLYLQGTGDRAMGIELLDAGEPALAAGSRIVRIEGANHFLHLEQPERINGEIAGWLAQ
jgi:pimeloyl-ACP methyl ester carboxylesterase